MRTIYKILEILTVSFFLKLDFYVLENEYFDNNVGVQKNGMVKISNFVYHQNCLLLTSMSVQMMRWMMPTGVR